MYNPYNNQYIPNYAPYQQQNMYQQFRTGLLGKEVENADMVRVADIPYDGSKSYFPLTDGSAIITKQLQQDGTSRMTVYKRVEEKQETPRYITENELKGLKDEIEAIKKQLESKEVPHEQI